MNRKSETLNERAAVEAVLPQALLDLEDRELDIVCLYYIERRARMVIGEYLDVLESEAGMTVASIMRGIVASLGRRGVIVDACGVEIALRNYHAIRTPACVLDRILRETGNEHRAKVDLDVAPHRLGGRMGHLIKVDAIE